MRGARQIATGTWALALALVATADRPQSTAPARVEREHALAAAVTAAAQPGDLIFISAAGTWSDLARFLSRRDRMYSHVGVISRGRGGLVVIHAGGNPVQANAVVRADTIAGFAAVMIICVLASLVSIRLALRVDPAEAIGG